MSKVLSVVGLPRSTFYYRSVEGKRGEKPSRVVKDVRGRVFPEEYLVEEIKSLLSGDFVDYGYIKVTEYLKDRGYVINKKRVYRVMKENKLLVNLRFKSYGKREFVKERVMVATEPYQKLQMDIKYIYVQGEGRNVYLLAVMDIFSRKVLGHKVARSIRKEDVIELMDEVILRTTFPREVTIRTDNGAQFIAHRVRDYLNEIGIEQEFTHVSSPRENGYIESLYSIVEREVVEKFEFESLSHLVDVLKRYFKFYNERRIHSGIGYRSPDRFLREYRIENEKLAKCG